MKAIEAKKITELAKKVNSVYQQIKTAAHNADNSIKLHISYDVKMQLKLDGYYVNDDIDGDSDYRGTWISW